MAEETRALLDRHGFRLRASDRVRDLGFAQRQLVEIVKAVSRGAEVLIMDEPTSSLTVAEEEALFGIIADLKRRGIAIVYISHRMAEIFRVADRISIVKDGRLIGPLDPGTTTVGRVADLMSSTPTAAEGPAGRVHAAPGGREPALAVRGLGRGRKLDGVTLGVGAGEVVGLAGLVGSGRSTLAKAIFGLLADARGEILVAGEPLRPGSPRRAIAAGVGFVPEDRRLEGL